MYYGNAYILRSNDVLCRTDAQRREFKTSDGKDQHLGWLKRQIDGKKLVLPSGYDSHSHGESPN